MASARPKTVQNMLDAIAEIRAYLIIYDRDEMCCYPSGTSEHCPASELARAAWDLEGWPLNEWPDMSGFDDCQLFDPRNGIEIHPLFPAMVGLQRIWHVLMDVSTAMACALIGRTESDAIAEIAGALRDASHKLGAHMGVCMSLGYTKDLPEHCTTVEPSYDDED